MLYFDYAAHTPVDPAVLDCYCAAATGFVGNPNSVHAAGAAAKAEMDRLLASMARLLDVPDMELICTSGASEANNTAIKGLARASRHQGHHILSTALEHASVSGCLTQLQEQGYEIDLVPIDRTGKIDLEEFRALLRKDTVLVAVSAVDSELGTIQPVGEIAEILRQYPNCRLHVDATQAVGKVPVCLGEADTVSLSPHKFGGLTGTGLLLKRKGVVLEPLIHGGASTTIYRSGTPDLAGTAAMERAISLAITELDERRAVVAARNAALRAGLSAFPLVRINSPADAIPHILNLSVTGVRGTDFQKALSDRGVCVSVKSACSTAGTPSRAVFAVSRDKKNALCSWRISLSHRTTEADVAEFLEIFARCYKTLTEKEAQP
jgi:cysteine desulfurase